MSTDPEITITFTREHLEQIINENNLTCEVPRDRIEDAIRGNSEVTIAFDYDNPNDGGAKGDTGPNDNDGGSPEVYFSDSTSKYQVTGTLS